MERWQEAWQLRSKYFRPQIGFARPNRTSAISLTGNHCALHCAHCNGHYLRGMVDIRDADATGMTSCLISGGCDQRGRVPVTAHLAQIQALRPGRLLNWHVGFIAENDLCAIAPYVDIISFDFVGDNETIREVYGLDYTVDDYLRTYQLLRRHAKVVPHLTIGLHGGKIRGEYHALHLLKAVGLDALVLLVFIPTPETRYAHCQPPFLDEVTDFLLTARLILPDTPLYLGCMRPGGRYRRELDRLAVRAGVNKIVNPAPAAIQEAKDLSLAIQWETECCVIQRS
ncbi:MAG: radical SAM protein [Chloroflexi bacterium]|nr:radical SAM protein [Chloroflexota bacterium]